MCCLLQINTMRLETKFLQLDTPVIARLKTVHDVIHRLRRSCVASTMSSFPDHQIGRGPLSTPTAVSALSSLSRGNVVVT
jgi:hypothetical protein